MSARFLRRGVHYNPSAPSQLVPSGDGLSQVLSSSSGQLAGRVYLPHNLALNGGGTHLYGTTQTDYDLWILIPGMGATAQSMMNSTLPTMTARMADGTIAPAIIGVPEFIDPLAPGEPRNTWAQNVVGGTFNSPRLFIEWLARLRSVTRWNGRANRTIIGGFSHGGFCALVLSILYPELFCCCLGVGFPRSDADNPTAASSFDTDLLTREYIFGSQAKTPDSDDRLQRGSPVASISGKGLLDQRWDGTTQSWQLPLCVIQSAGDNTSTSQTNFRTRIAARGRPGFTGAQGSSGSDRWRDVVTPGHVAQDYWALMTTDLAWAESKKVA